MKLLLIAAALLAQLRPDRDLRMPPDIDLAAESVKSQTKIFENEVVKVSEVVKPANVKELHFPQERPAFFILPSRAVVWMYGPVAIRGNAIRVDLKYNPGQAKNDPKDGVIAAPMSHRVIFENRYVRVLDVSVPVGVKEPMHTHPYPGFFIRDAEFMANRYFKAGGVTTDTARTPKPDKTTIQWMGPEALHAVENRDTIVTPMIRVELKAG